MIKRPAWIFDVDGTLADVDPLLHWISNQDRASESFKQNFEKFHSESIYCRPHAEVVDMLWEKVNKFDIIVVTARQEKWRAHTAYWMVNNNIPHTAMFMRQDADSRPDYEIKKDILEHVKLFWDVKHAVDDNPNIIRLWEENGIPTTKIGDWDGVHR
jgi:FMN phosphatase YigB (HAD superfamily)